MTIEGYGDNDAETLKDNDIDTNADGKVNSAVSADDATNVTSTYKGIDLDTSYANQQHSGMVDTGTVANLYTCEVANGNSLEVYQATLIYSNGNPAPSGVDLVIATLDGVGGSTKQATVLSADGTANYADETGTPLASYSNTSGSAQIVMVGIDNGHYTTGTGADEDVVGGFIGREV